MRKGVKLAGLLAAGVAAFAVACSPVCNPVPVADPHGTPEQQWNWCRGAAQGNESAGLR